MEHEGNYVVPAITEIDPESEIVQYEIFAPLLHTFKELAGRTLPCNLPLHGFSELHALGDPCVPLKTCDCALVFFAATLSFTSAPNPSFKSAYHLFNSSKMTSLLTLT